MRLTGCLLAAVVGTTAVLVAAPAWAENTCGGRQDVEFETPGFNTDLRVRLCVTHGSPTRGAYAQVSWTNGGDNATDGERKFDSLVIHYRLRSGSTTVTTGSCDLTAQINVDDSAVWTCPAAYSGARASGGWRVDGHLLYNIDRDGDGVKRLDLTTTPTVTA